jgi:putative phosphoribosyl transferase
VLVLAIPRGGVEVGYQVARTLDADFSLVVTRKLPYPDNPEAGFGAIAEDGSTFMIENPGGWLSSRVVEAIIEEQKAEIERRIQVLRGGGPLPEIEGRTVILVDDGIAMGSTMRASIELCKNRNAARIVVGVPVASQRVRDEIEKTVDEIVVLEAPAFFRAVAQVYRDWYDVSDDQVLEIMTKWRKERAG